MLVAIKSTFLGLLFLGALVGVYWTTLANDAVVTHVSSFSVGPVSTGSFDLTSGMLLALTFSVMFVLIAVFWRIKGTRTHRVTPQVADSGGMSPAIAPKVEMEETYLFSAPAKKKKKPK